MLYNCCLRRCRFPVQQPDGDLLMELAHLILPKLSTVRFALPGSSIDGFWDKFLHISPKLVSAKYGVTQ